MKRSERIFHTARYTLAKAMALLGALIALTAWAARVFQSSPSGGAAMCLLALAALYFSTIQMVESIRFFKLSLDEERREWRRAVRPRL